MRTKLAIKSDNITSFNGFFYVMDFFGSIGLSELV